MPGPAPGVYVPPVSVGGDPSGGGTGRSTVPGGRSKLMLWLALGTAAVSLLLAPLSPHRPAVSLLGWLLGGFVAVGLLSAWTYAEARAKADPWALTVPDRFPFRLLALAAAVVAVALHAYFFADWAARR